MLTQSASRPCRHRATNGFSVAIVDDDAALGAALATLVNLVPRLTVRWAATGVDQAIDLLHSARVDLALIDVRMPAGGGLAVVEALQAFDEAPKVILMSADTEPEGVPMGIRFIDKSELDLTVLQAVAAELR